MEVTFLKDQAQKYMKSYHLVPVARALSPLEGSGSPPCKHSGPLVTNIRSPVSLESYLALQHWAHHSDTERLRH